MDDAPPDLLIVAADHPSLDDAIAAFGAELHAETRYFGGAASAPPGRARPSSSA